LGSSTSQSTPASLKKSSSLNWFRVR
jgi:hypothetical protein